ncbi:hypothetical protein F5Y12DRAFT_798388 [Xylaria sp. FL1777]|nr:hypothetical protein F5Y12DRAFT_798388 [Xylaria sp. FL1777]
MSTTAVRKDGSAARVREMWREASAQINASCNTITLNIEAVDSLGRRGENYFVYRCCILLGKHAEFIFDNSDRGKVYLGNPEDIETEMNSVVVHLRDDRFPVLHHQYRASPEQSQDTETS